MYGTKNLPKQLLASVVGPILRTLIEENNIGIKELSSKTLLDCDRIGQVMDGRGAVKPLECRRLAAALGITVGELALPQEDVRRRRHRAVVAEREELQRRLTFYRNVRRLTELRGVPLARIARAMSSSKAFSVDYYVRLFTELSFRVDRDLTFGARSRGPAGRLASALGTSVRYLSEHRLSDEELERIDVAGLYESDVELAETRRRRRRDNFCNNLSRIRELHDLTYADLTRMVGYASHALQMNLSGRHIDADVWEAEFARAFRVPPGWLCQKGRSDEELLQLEIKKPEPNLELFRSLFKWKECDIPALERTVARLAALPPDNRKAAVSLLREIVDREF